MSDPAQKPLNNSKPPSDFLTRRSIKQLSLFVAGSSFLAISTLITRRSLVRRYLSTRPHFYQPSNLPPRAPINGAFEAFEALNIATVNVFSFAIMMTGGALWAFDISTLDEMRRKVRGGLGVDGTGRGEREVEEEWEEWVAGVLKRKKEKERGAGEEKRRNDRGKER